MLQIALNKIKCNVETDEYGADEPYVLVAAVDYSSTTTIEGFNVPIPSFEVTKYGPFKDVDQHETHNVPSGSPSFWGLNNNPMTLSNPDSAIFIVAVMENDDGDPEVLRGIVKGIIAASVFGGLSFSRAERVTKLINDINAVLRTPTGVPNFDDKVGLPKELRFSSEELLLADTFFGIRKEMVFVGDGGMYTLTFGAHNPQAIIGRNKGFNIRQASSGRFTDAYESGSNDYSLVTRTDQRNNTQRWFLNEIGKVYTIQQKINNKYVDAHENTENDFSLVTRSFQGDDTQKWVVLPGAGGTSTIQQLSSGRFIDAYQTTDHDFSVVTRDHQDDNTQRWIISTEAEGGTRIVQRSNYRNLDAYETGSLKLVTRSRQENDTQKWLLNQIGSVYTIQQRSTGRFVDAHETADNNFSLVTRGAQNNDTQRWVVIPRPDGTSTIQQLSSGRFMDAYETRDKDYNMVTRPLQNNNTQRWFITPA